LGVNDIGHAIASICKGIAGVSAVCEFLPSSIAQTPCFLIVPKSGEQPKPPSPSQKLYAHDFYVDLYFSKGGDLANTDAVMRPFIDLVQDTFNQHKQLNSTCYDSYITQYSYGVALKYGDVHYLGIRFTLNALEYGPYQYQP
jgi:hypothetical protein